jgi:hypothetical protein
LNAIASNLRSMHIGTFFGIFHHLREIRFSKDDRPKDGRVNSLAFSNFWQEELITLKLDTDTC